MNNICMEFVKYTVSKNWKAAIEEVAKTTENLKEETKKHQNKNQWRKHSISKTHFPQVATDEDLENKATWTSWEC